MERREFFKKAVVTPLLTPLFLAANKRKSDCELHLITDDIQVFLPLILEELDSYVPNNGHSFALLNSHPQGNALKRILSQRGFSFLQPSSRKNFALLYFDKRRKNLGY
jgi:hypothetical protein